MRIDWVASWGAALVLAGCSSASSAGTRTETPGGEQASGDTPTRTETVRPAPASERRAQAGPDALACAPPAAPAPAASAHRTAARALPFDPGDSGLRLEPDEPDFHPGELVLCGRVVSIERAPSPPRMPGRVRWLVVLDSQPPNRFIAAFPEHARRPIDTGDAISVHISRTTSGIHPVTEATLAEAGGRLLAAFSDDGDARWAPGWSLEVGRVARSNGPPHMRGGAIPRDNEIVLRYLGTRTAVPPNEWRRVSTPDGEWIVTGYAQTWTSGFLPPDASTYATFVVMRLRAD